MVTEENGGKACAGFLTTFGETCKIYKLGRFIFDSIPIDGGMAWQNSASGMHSVLRTPIS